MHDVTALRTDGIEDLLRRYPDVQAEVDAGYQGLARDFRAQVSAPPKARKDAPAKKPPAGNNAGTSSPPSGSASSTPSPNQGNGGPCTAGPGVANTSKTPPWPRAGLRPRRRTVTTDRPTRRASTPWPQSCTYSLGATYRITCASRAAAAGGTTAQPWQSGADVPDNRPLSRPDSSDWTGRPTRAYWAPPAAHGKLGPRLLEQLTVRYLRLVTGNRAHPCGAEQLPRGCSGLVVRYDVEQDDRGPFSQGDRFPAPCECLDWCVEPEKAQRSRCLAVP